jgi:hypothetical protein
VNKNEKPKNCTFDQALYGRTATKNTGYNYYIIDAPKLSEDARAKFTRKDSKLKKEYGSYTRCLILNNLSDGVLSSGKQAFCQYASVLKEPFGFSDELIKTGRPCRIRTDIYERFLNVFNLKDIYRYNLIEDEKSEGEWEPDELKAEPEKKADQNPELYSLMIQAITKQNELLAEISETLKSMDRSWRPKPVARLLQEGKEYNSDIHITGSKVQKGAVG